MSAVEDVVAKTEGLEIDPKATEPTTGNGANDPENRTKAEEKKVAAEGKQPSGSNEGNKKEEVALHLEPKSGVSFPVMLDDGKQLNATGLRKKGMFGIGIKVYGFGIYTDNQKLKDLLRSKIETAPTKPTKEMYEMVIDNDVGLTVKMVIVYSYLTVGMVRKSFDDGLGAAIKKLTGGKNEESTKKLMGETSDDTKLPKDSEVEISRLPGNILQTKVMGEVVSTIQSEILCRAYAYLYLGDDPFDKEAKENVGNFLLSLF